METIDEIHNHHTNCNFQLMKIEIVFFFGEGNDSKNSDVFINNNPNEVVKNFQSRDDLDVYLQEITERNSTKFFLITTMPEIILLNEKGIFNKSELADVFILYVDAYDLYDEDTNVKIYHPKIKLYHDLFSGIEKMIIDNLLLYRKISPCLSYYQQKVVLFYDTSESYEIYIFYQCLMNLFYKQNEDKIACKDFFDYCKDFFDNCKSHYSLYQEGDEEPFKKLEKDMQGMVFTEAIIKWYTNDSFFYKLINSVIESDEIFNIFKIRYALSTISKSLNNINNTYYPKKLYRPSLVSREEITTMKKLLKKKTTFLNMRGFVSASTDIKINENFIKTFDTVPVLYEINIKDEFISNVINIEKDSYFNIANEYIIKFNTPIELIKIDKIDDKNFEYLISLSLCDNNDLLNFIDSNKINTAKFIKEVENKNCEFDYFYFIKILKYLRGNNELLFEVLKFCDDNRYIDKNNEAEFNQWYGICFKEKGDFDSAIKSYKKSLEIHISEVNPIYTATSYNNIGSVYQDKGDFNLALEYFQKCLEIESSSADNHISIAKSFNNIGSVYQDIGDYDSAIENYKKSIEIHESNLGHSHLSTAASYNNIGSVFQNKGDFNSAMTNYKKSMEILESNLGTDNLSTAASYNNIANLYKVKGDLDAAQIYYQKSLHIHESNLGNMHLSKAISYKNLGSVFKSKGAIDSALNCYKSCLKIYEFNLPANHFSIVEAYNNIGIVYQDNQNYDLALQNYERSLEIYESTLGNEKNDNYMAVLYNNIAMINQARGDLDSAMKYYQLSLKIEESVASDQIHASRAISYNNIASLFQDKGDLSSALKYHKQCLNLREQILEKDDPSIAISYNNMGLLYHAKGDFDKALEYLEKCLKIRESKLGKDHISTAISYNNIARIYKEKRNWDSALKYYELSLNVYKSKFGSDHPYIATAYNNISRLYEAKGDLNLARTYFNSHVKKVDSKIITNNPSIKKNKLPLKSLIYLVDS